jgi:poly(A) polymerase
MNGLPTIVDGRLKDRHLLEDGRLARALEALDGAGEETRLVGGAVRDLALGLPAGDFDLATTAPPGVVMRRARAAGFGVAPTGLRHGTVTLIVDGLPIETTTLREDVETDGRHAKVLFGRDFAEDARRRDFTINALSLSRDGAVHDYVGGLADLAARRVRFIGDARTRIREDFLRSLRFFRFSASYSEGPLDAEGYRAAIEEREGLQRLSRERLRAELMKLLKARRAGEVVAQCCEAGLLGPLIGGIANPLRLKRLIAVEAALAMAPDPLLRLGALGLVIAEDADRLRDRLRLSNAEYERLAGGAAALERLHNLRALSLGDLRALLFERKRTAAQDGLILAHVDSTAAPDDASFSSAFRFVRDTPEPTLPFTGADIVARGIAQGQGVGKVLKSLQALWIRAGFPREPEQLARLLDEALAKTRQRSG